MQKVWIYMVCWKSIKNEKMKFKTRRNRLRKCRQCGNKFPKEKIVIVHGVQDCLDCALKFYESIDDKLGIERVNNILEANLKWN